eukprot:TRINITY_DN8630_c0_g2_i1.p1 TRINITY_DN8630_c0_g2~~TRINITY_DN8630_c0_g2_i1.p1  ORF type:complete len:1054 (+),score=261.76 TRINITY_DN8630_c0_g2_i1:60-3221(+)
MFNFDGVADRSHRVGLAGKGQGRKAGGARAEESRAEFLKRQQKEREARELKRLREKAATLIQAAYRRHRCMTALRAQQRQIFDKRQADIAKVGAVLPPDKKAKFVYHALLPMLRLFAFFFAPRDDGNRLLGLLQLLLLSASQLGEQVGNNIFHLALVEDDQQRLNFLLLLRKLIAALIRVNKLTELAQAVLAMQRSLFNGRDDRAAEPAKRSAEAARYLLQRTDILSVLTTQELPAALEPQRMRVDGSLTADDVESLLHFFCAGLEATVTEERARPLCQLLSLPYLGEYLCPAAGQVPRACTSRLVELVLTTPTPGASSEGERAGVREEMAERVLGSQRRTWLLRNVVGIFERVLMADGSGISRLEGLLVWMAWIRHLPTAASDEDPQLVAEIERLNQGSFVRNLLQALEKQSSGGLLAACRLYFASDGSEGSPSLDPPPEVLQALAFATPLVERLFPDVRRILMQHTAAVDTFQALGPPGFVTEDAMRLRIFCVVYRLQLQPMYDYEFFGSANALGLAEVEQLARLLNRLAYHFVTTSPDRLALPPAARALRVGITSLVAALYQRHQRRPIMSGPAPWVIPDSKLLLRRAPVVDLGNDEAAEEGAGEVGPDHDEDVQMTPADESPQAATSAYTSSWSRSASNGTHGAEKVLEAVLEELPHVVPFEDRVTLLHNVIVADQEQRRDTRGPWSMFSLNRHQIRRERLVEDGMSAFENLMDENSLRDVFRVQFIAPDGGAESGVDGGGLFKEFMIHICRVMFSPEFGLFSVTDAQTLYPSVAAFWAHGPKAADFYTFLGKVVGKAIYEMFLLEPQFSRVFLNRLLGRINEVDDIAALDAQLHKSMVEIRESSNVEDLGLTFSVTLSDQSYCEEVDLIPNGRNVAVTRANLTRYLHLMANYRSNIQFQRHAAAFSRGLQCVIPIAWLKMFDPYELNRVISGSSAGFDVTDLKANIVYSGGYVDDSPAIRWLWDLINNMQPDDMSRFLMFVTSCSRPPLLGFKTLYPKFCVHRVPDSSRLPTASTCANLLKLPDYPNAETLSAKLLQAIRAEAGFDLS